MNLNLIALAILLISFLTCFVPGAQAASADHKVYPVFFISNRKAQQAGDTTEFTSSRSADLSYGEYLADENTTDVRKAKLVLFKTQQEFLDAVKNTGSKKIALFVHGYRKSFSGSMNFGLTMSKHLDTPLVVFAWPSKNNYCKYMVDECTAEWSSHQLADTFEMLGQQVGFQNIAVICHSLGVRMAEWALRDLYAEHHPKDPFGAFLFFSPDVDRDSFLSDASFLKKACMACRVFLDPHDTRIWISKKLHGSPRLGSMDKNGSQPALEQIFRCDTSLPNHEIPFELVSTSVRQMTQTDLEN